MSGGSGVKDDLREHYTPLPVAAMGIYDERKILGLASARQG
jgi:hypothetical protein